MDEEVLSKATPSQHWYTNKANMDLLSLGVAILSLMATAALSVWLFFLQEGDIKLTRSIKEIDRTYDPEFVNSLSRILSHAYRFIGDPALNNLPKKERFEAFWNTFNTDADIIVVATRLDSIEVCYHSRDCIRDELLSRFSNIVYESIFYLRDFLFLDEELQRENATSEIYGWWLDKDIYGFLADYCSWRQTHGGVELWDESYERKRDPGATDIDPCLDPKGLQ